MAYSYARRNELRQAQGWQNYAQYRRAQTDLRQNPDVIGRSRTWEQTEADTGEVGAGGDDESTYAAWYRAFRDPKESHKVGIDSPKAKWFVEVTGQVVSYSDWIERYGG